MALCGRVASAAIALLLLAATAQGRISSLSLWRERRHYFIVSSFGLLQGGKITIRVGDYKTRGSISAAGFSIHRNGQKATEYDMSLMSLDRCFLTTPPSEVTETSPHYVKLIFNGSENVLRSDHHTLGGVVVSEPASEVIDDKLFWVTEITLKSAEAEDEYTVAFHRCDVSPLAVGSVSAEIDIIEVNPGPDYLGAGLAPLAMIYFIMAGAFFACTVAWALVLRANKDSPQLFRVHYLMLALMGAKTLSLLLRGVDYHYIKTTGHENKEWAALFYTVHLAKGVMLFSVILLIGAGFGFIKHALSKNERMIFLIVIPLQLISGIAWILIEESAEGSSVRSTWTSIGLMIDLVCCVAVLFPVVWSIRHLRESSATDGKAAASLNKLRLFRKFYVMVLAYIYTTRILVYLISNSMEFQYEWLGPFFSEIVSLIFYITTGIMFSPEPGNEYLQVPEHDSDIDDHDEESGTVVTTTSVGDGMKRVRRPKEEPSAAVSIQQRKDMGLEPDF
eukprot:m.113156 g.113156  ORF g.113156 m.113156 type:complete len:505 (-) comp10794_c1_seq1:3309-4823(-)